MNRQLNIIPETSEEKIYQAVTGLGYNKDVIKARKGNKSAARRIRKILLQIQKDCKSARKELLQITKS